MVNYRKYNFTLTIYGSELPPPPRSACTDIKKYALCPWNGEKSVTKRLSAQIFVLITARHTESMVKAPQNVALRINVVCPSASPRKYKTKNAYGRSSGLKQRLIKPHAFPYYRKKRHFTVAGGTAETAAGAAGQLAQTSLLNAPISPKHDRLHLGAYLHAPFSFTIIL